MTTESIDRGRPIPDDLILATEAVRLTGFPSRTLVRLWREGKLRRFRHPDLIVTFYSRAELARLQSSIEELTP